MERVASLRLDLTRRDLPDASAARQLGEEVEEFVALSPVPPRHPLNSAARPALGA
ncbi:hypothetical protein [Streptomyces sp. PT12]|uniref:hypothetical protein n=1 Tax=Streptomyces sp. PT12 TaxID=1510197 RepID=UPI0015EED314|nr:hypothetical protein [Streptomyces sp. PT12]